MSGTLAEMQEIEVISAEDFIVELHVQQMEALVDAETAAVHGDLIVVGLLLPDVA